MGGRGGARRRLLRVLGRFAAGTLGSFTFYLVGSMLLGGWPGLLPVLPQVLAVSAVVGLGRVFFPPSDDTPDAAVDATARARDGQSTPSGRAPVPSGSSTWRPAVTVRAGMLVIAVGMVALGGYLVTVPGIGPFPRMFAVLGLVGLGIWTLSGVFLWLRLEPEQVVVHDLGWSTRQVTLDDIEAVTAGPDGIALRLRDGTLVLSRVVQHRQWRGPDRPSRAVRIATQIEAAATRHTDRPKPL